MNLSDSTRPGISRRDFVRTSIAGAAVGAGAVMGFRSARDSARTSGAPFEYLGMRLVDGPTTTGLPLIRVRTRADDSLEGIMHDRRWYEYCQRAGAPGLEGGYPHDSIFRFHLRPEIVELSKRRGTAPPYVDRLGQPVTHADLPAVGDGAMAVWRSVDGIDTNRLTAVLVRVDPSRYPSAIAREWFPDGVMGAAAQCTHLCCDAHYHVSKDAKDRDRWDTVYCTCHGATYDPTLLSWYPGPADGDGLPTRLV